MEFTLSTPALLFPAISLLFIAYTNRFVSYANLIRNLHDRWREDRSAIVEGQIENLRKRVVMIRNMQIAGAAALLLCVVCMLVLLIGLVRVAEVLFVLSLLGMTFSLSLLVREIQISVRALDLQLHDMQGAARKGGGRGENSAE